MKEAEAHHQNQQNESRNPGFPEKFGWKEAFGVCQLSLYDMWSGVVSFLEAFNNARNSIRYNI